VVLRCQTLVTPSDRPRVAIPGAVTIMAGGSAVGLLRSAATSGRQSRCALWSYGRQWKPCQIAIGLCPWRTSSTIRAR